MGSNGGKTYLIDFGSWLVEMLSIAYHQMEVFTQIFQTGIGIALDSLRNSPDVDRLFNHFVIFWIPL